MKKISIFLIGLMTLASGSALAQDQESGNAIEEVIVTAQKREQSMQEVGIAVSAFSGDRLQAMGIDGISQIQDHTPNLRIKPTITSVPQYSIRGVGENADTSALSSSPVALHINEVAQPYPVATSNLLFDLERVEVLRGPQGDLFGLNSTAGTINFVTNRASQERGGSVLLEVGNYDRYKVEGFLNGGLSDSLSARLAFSHNDRGNGWQVNEATGEKLGEFQKSGARLSFNFSPSDTFSADLELHASRDDSDNIGLRNVANFVGLDPVPTLIGLDDFLLFAAPVTRYNGTGWTSFTRGAELEGIGLINTDLFPAGTRPYIDNEGHGASLVMNWNLQDITVTSVTGWESFDREEFNDSDGDEIQDSGQYFESELAMWSQELRVAGTARDDTVNWTLGANVASDELEQLTLFVQTENVDFPGVGGQNPIQERDVWAIFSHVDWRLRDNLELVTGLRYTSEKRKQLDITTYKMGQPLDIVELLSGSVFAPDPNDPFGRGTPLTDAGFLCFAVAIPCTPGFVQNKDIKDTEWSGKLGLNYFANDDWMIYGSFARGFKSGGFLDTAASNSGSFVNSKPEFLNAYEFGAKGDFNDGRARLNMAVFYYDYEDQQVGDFLIDPLFGPLGKIVNAPKSEVYGGEIELILAPTDNFEILQNLGYSKGKFKEFIGVDADASRDTVNDPANGGFYTTVYIDRAGDKIEMPNLQYSGSLAYSRDLGNGMSTRLVVDYSYEDSVDTDRTWTDALTGEVHNFGLPSYWLVNARLMLMGNESWEVTLFGANLLDEEYLLDYTRFNQGVVQVVGMPRTYGVRFKYDF